MKIITCFLLLIFLVNVNAQNLRKNFTYRTDKITNYKLIIPNPSNHDLIGKKEFNLDLNFSSSRSADFKMRPLLISTSIGLAIGIPLGLIRQIKYGSVDCNMASWIDCIIGPHPLVNNIIFWGGLGVTIGISASF